MKRFKGICSYDGTDLYGWQSQAGGNTVQDYLEKNLRKIFKKDIRVHGSGRTDAGVHAKGQVFHFDADWAHPTENLLKALRQGLIPTIQIGSLVTVKNTFHARYSVTAKRYTYYFYLGHAPAMEWRYCWSLGGDQCNVTQMRSAAQRLVGEHDYSAFGAKRRGEKGDNPVKNIHKVEIIQRGKHLKMTTEGSGYLYKMVRSFAGTLINVGIGKISAADVERFLKNKKRVKEIQTAPPQGLCLERVYY